MNLPLGCTNLTARAKNKSYSFVGRDEELEEITECLLRIKKPNVLLIGDPGVGKTAIIKQLAWLIANETIHPSLLDYQMIEVNTNALLSGEGYRGVFEKKIQDIIEAVSGKKVILFIDEFHTAVNLGQMANGQTPGFGNAFKPILTDGSVRMIGATTTDEAKTITDKALLRRFTKVKVDEPPKEVIVRIIMNCLNNYDPKREVVIEVSDIEEKIYQLSLNIEGNNPDKADELVDSMMAAAKLRQTNIDEVFMNRFVKRTLKSRGISVDNAVNVNEEKEVML